MGRVQRRIWLVIAATLGASLVQGAQTARTVLYANNCADRSDWEHESEAEGPADSNGQDQLYAQVFRGLTSSQELTNTGWRDSTGATFSFDEAAWRITAIYVNVKCRFDTGSANNSVRLRSYDTGSGATSISPGWNQSASDDSMKWRFAGDGWNIVGQRVSWTASNIRDLDVAVRRESGSTQLRVDALRLIVERTLIDADGDGIADVYDNCPANPNPDQADSDGDGVGNVCDNCANYNPTQADSDHDGVPDGCDNCPNAPNPTQADWNGNGIGDACEDYDKDGVVDALDNCRTRSNAEQWDRDGDGVGDSCDNCYGGFNPDQKDSDHDGIGDVCEDPDGDGLETYRDNCPFNANPDQLDWNHNGIGDACEDSDGDGRLDKNDNCPGVPNISQADSDLDGVGDACDTCPGNLNRRTDYDDDGIDSACDPDEPVLMDPLGAANRPPDYVPGYPVGAWFRSDAPVVDGSGQVVAFGRRANGGGSTGGGFAAADTAVQFDGESSVPNFSATVRAGARDTGGDRWETAFASVYMNFAVVHGRYYRLTHTGDGYSMVRLASSLSPNSKYLPPGDYYFSCGIGCTTQDPESGGYGTARLEFLQTDPCPADIDANGQVNDDDFVLFVAAYTELVVPLASPLADFTGDGFVDDSDFVYFHAAYDRVFCQ